jgi:hypothetical protein
MYLRLLISLPDERDRFLEIIWHGGLKMKKRIAARVCQLVFLLAMITGLSVTAYAARQQVTPAYGYYKIVATNGHGNGQELYYDSKASKKDLKWKDDGTIWYISQGPYNGSCHIRLADDPSYYIDINETYVGNDQKVKVVKDDGRNVMNNVIYFFMESGSSIYENLTISIYDWAGFRYDYKLNRHRSVGYDYVNLRSDSDTNNKLWKLVPVNYTKSMNKAAPVLTASSGGNASVNWNGFRNKIKNSEVWKKAKFIEIQYSTDKYFAKNVKSKKIRKGTVNKKNAKTALSKLKKNKAYYFRARLIDSKGVYSNWSKTVKITIT